MTTQKIMVQLADREWTLRAVHQACLLARQNEAEVVLMSMVPVQHLSWLGTEFGTMNFTADKRAALQDYAETAEDYGVRCLLHIFQYAILDDAILEAADIVDAQVVFATLPHSIIPYWRQFLIKRLRHHLAQHHRQLIDPETLDTSQYSTAPQPETALTLSLLARQD